MKPSNRDPAAIAAAFERADAIVALEGFVPDDNYKAIQRRVIAGELTSDQAVQLVIALGLEEPDRICALPCVGRHHTLTWGAVKALALKKLKDAAL